MTVPRDCWDAMLQVLAGLPAQPLPALPGRRHAAEPERLAEQIAERARREATAGSGGRRPTWNWATSRAHER